MPPYLVDDDSTLVQVMAWCRQATSHYMSQCWPRSMSPYGVSIGHSVLKGDKLTLLYRVQKLYLPAFCLQSPADISVHFIRLVGDARLRIYFLFWCAYINNTYLSLRCLVIRPPNMILLAPGWNNLNHINSWSNFISSKLWSNIARWCRGSELTCRFSSSQRYF